MTDIAGIDHDSLVRWFDERVGGVDGGLKFDLITGGRSNLTFTVADGSGRCWVLRRPPMGHVLATAHDMARSTGSSAPWPTAVYLSRPSSGSARTRR